MPNDCFLYSSLYLCSFCRMRSDIPHVRGDSPLLPGAISEHRQAKVTLVILQKRLLCRQLSFIQHSHSCMYSAPASGRAFSFIYLSFFHCLFSLFALLSPHSLICPPCFSCLFLSYLNPFELFLFTGVCKLHPVSHASFINIPFIQSQVSKMSEKTGLVEIPAATQQMPPVPFGSIAIYSYTQVLNLLIF